MPERYSAADWRAIIIQQASLGTSASCKCQSSLLTQRELLLGLGRCWGCAVKKVRNVRPAPHLQALGNPLQGHGRLLPEPPSNGELAPVPFALSVQVRFYPAQPLHFLGHNSL